MSEEDNQNAVQLTIVKGQESGAITLDYRGIPIIAEDVTYEQWLEAIKMVKWAKRHADMGLASLIAFGNRKFGPEAVNKALEQYEFEATMVKTAIQVNSIPEELRFENLEAGHYVELAKAGISKKQMLKWARVASEQSLSPTQLRLSIIEGEVIDPAATKMIAHGLVTIHGIRQSFDIWHRRVGGLEGVQAMDSDNQQDILGELEAIVKFGNELYAALEVPATQ